MMSQDIRKCAALLFYTPCYSQESLKLEEENAPLKLQSGKFEADMRRQLHAMYYLIAESTEGLIVKFH